jgi:hypothetical protein
MKLFFAAPLSGLPSEEAARWRAERLLVRRSAHGCRHQVKSELIAITGKKDAPAGFGRCRGAIAELVVGLDRRSQLTHAGLQGPYSVGQNSTVRSRRTRSTCKGRSSAASIDRFAVAVSRFEFAVGTALDRMLIFGESHLRRVLASYAAYYNQARTHLALRKDAPLRRAVQGSGTIIATPILFGLLSGGQPSRHAP